MQPSRHSGSAILFPPSQTLMHLVLSPTLSPTGQHAKHKSKLLQLSPQSPVYQRSLVSCHDSLCLSSESYTSHPRPLQTRSQGQTALPRQQEGWLGSWSWLLSDASRWHLSVPSTGHVKRFEAMAKEWDVTLRRNNERMRIGHFPNVKQEHFGFDYTVMLWFEWIFGPVWFKWRKFILN